MSNVLKDLHEAKTSESSQNFYKGPKFKFLVYLPCPCKFPIQNYFLACYFYLLLNLIFKIFAALFMTNLGLNIGKKIICLSIMSINNL